MVDGKHSTRRAIKEGRASLIEAPAAGIKLVRPRKRSVPRSLLKEEHLSTQWDSLAQLPLQLIPDKRNSINEQAEKNIAASKVENVEYNQMNQTGPRTSIQHVPYDAKPLKDTAVDVEKSSNYNATQFDDVLGSADIRTMRTRIRSEFASATSGKPPATAPSGTHGADLNQDLLSESSNKDDDWLPRTVPDKSTHNIDSFAAPANGFHGAGASSTLFQPSIAAQAAQLRTKADTQSAKPTTPTEFVNDGQDELPDLASLFEDDTSSMPVALPPPPPPPPPPPARPSLTLPQPSPPPETPRLLNPQDGAPAQCLPGMSSRLPGLGVPTPSIVHHESTLLQPPPAPRFEGLEKSLHADEELKSYSLPTSVAETLGPQERLADKLAADGAPPVQSKEMEKGNWERTEEE